MVIQSQAVNTKLVITKLLKSVTEVNHKVRQVLQSVKCDRLLLQTTSGVTKCDSYHKVKRNPSFI